MAMASGSACIAAPSRAHSRRRESVRRMALTAAWCPKRVEAAEPTSVRRTKSTEGSLLCLTGRVSFMCGQSRSIAQQEGVLAAAPPTFPGHQHVEPERGDIVGNRLQCRIVDLVEDLHIGAAAFTRLGLHRVGCALDRSKADAAGRAAEDALDANDVPHGSA